MGGIAVGAAVRSWPFRVFSFPSEPVVAPGSIMYVEEFYEEAVKVHKAVQLQVWDRLLKDIYTPEIKKQLNAHVWQHRVWMEETERVRG